MSTTHVSSTRRLAALAAGTLAAFALAACSTPSPSAPEVDTREVTLPDHVGDLLSYDGECDATVTDPEVLAKCHKNGEPQLAIADEFAARISAAYGGAAAAAAPYAVGGFVTQAEVFAVRADSPGLWTVYGGDTWEQRTGQRSSQKVVTVDGVDCLLMTDGTFTLDHDIVDEDYMVSTCQKSADGLTVRLLFGGGASLADYALEDIVAWTNDAYDSIS